MCRHQKAATCPTVLDDDIIAAALQASQLSFKSQQRRQPEGPARSTSDDTHARPRPSVSSSPPRSVFGFAASIGSGGGGSGSGGGAGAQPHKGQQAQQAQQAQRMQQVQQANSSAPRLAASPGAATAGHWGGTEAAWQRGSLTSGLHVVLQRGGSMQLERAKSTTEQLFDARADAATAQAQVQCLNEALSKVGFLAFFLSCAVRGCMSCSGSCSSAHPDLARVLWDLQGLRWLGRV